MTTPIDTPSNTLLPIAGLHHVTAITADPQKNLDFYTRILGLRLVKVTINYDDPGTYHLYYGDGLGRPGTLMTHFGWPMARRGATGAGHVVETAFAIPIASAPFWKARLIDNGVAGVEAAERFGDSVVTFKDADLMPLALIETPLAGNDQHLWRHGNVPFEHAIRAFHSVTLAETTATAAALVLGGRFGYREIARHGNRIRYEAQGSDVARFVDVVLVPNGSRSRMGAGQVHHVAFRTPTDDQQALWLQQLRTDGFNVSPVMDRDYFHSIYFREPGGVLFEIATDGPGMTHNESAEELGTHILLPAWLESQRAAVEDQLPKITLNSRVEGVSEEEKLVAAEAAL